MALRESGLRYKGDYTFLMHRLPGAELKPETSIGPPDQRFGAWAATLPAGQAIKFALDPDLERSLERNKVMIRVNFLDRGAGSLSVAAWGATFKRGLAGTGRWQDMVCTIEPLVGPLGTIVVETEGDLTLHMIEVARIR